MLGVTPYPTSPMNGHELFSTCQVVFFYQTPFLRYKSRVSPHGVAVAIEIVNIYTK